MSSQIIQTPFLSPVKLVRRNLNTTPEYQFRHFDQWHQRDQVFSFQDFKEYTQKYQTTDTIYIPIVANFGPVSCRLINCEGQTVVTGSIQSPNNPNYRTPDVYRIGIISLSGVSEGRYYVEMLIGNPSISLISEPIDIAVEWINTIRFDYSNGSFFGGLVFKDQPSFQFRCEAILRNFTPGNNQRVYEDQTANVVKLSSYPFRQFKLVIGDAYGVADWVPDKLNRIFGCDTVLLDGKEFVRADGASFEANEDPLYPLKGWTLDVREAKARDAAFIRDSIPQENSVTAAFVADTALFGDTAGASTTDALIIEID